MAEVKYALRCTIPDLPKDEDTGDVVLPSQFSPKSPTRSAESIRIHKAQHIKKVKVYHAQGKKPFCNAKKFEKLSHEMRANAHDCTLYQTEWEILRAEEKQNRTKFLHGNFVVVDHTATVAKREQLAVGSMGLAGKGKYFDPKPVGRDEDKSKFLTPSGFK